MKMASQPMSLYSGTCGLVANTVSGGLALLGVTDVTCTTGSGISGTKNAAGVVTPSRGVYSASPALLFSAMIALLSASVFVRSV